MHDFVKLRRGLFEHRMPSSARLVFVGALFWLKSDGTTSFSIRQVADLLKVGRDSVISGIKWLQEHPSKRQPFLTKIDFIHPGIPVYRMRNAEWNGRKLKSGVGKSDSQSRVEDCDEKPNSEIGSRESRQGVSENPTPKLRTGVLGVGKSDRGESGIPTGGVGKSDRLIEDLEEQEKRRIPPLPPLTPEGSSNSKSKSPNWAAEYRPIIIDLWGQIAAKWDTPKRTGGKAADKKIAIYVKTKADGERALEALRVLLERRPARFHTENDANYWNLGWLFQLQNAKREPVDRIQDIIDGVLLEPDEETAKPKGRKRETPAERQKRLWDASEARREKARQQRC